MRSRCLVVLASLAFPATGSADHGGMMMAAHAPDEASISAGVQLLAASYSTMSYVGDYEGAVPTVSWTRGAFQVGASMGFYRLQANGREVYGQGDSAIHGQATIVTSGAVAAGASLGVATPTGSSLDGFGMGHVMLMPSAWGSWSPGRWTVMASFGYGRALVGMENSHHDHGAWPLVDPMNMSELTWSAGGDYGVGSGVHAGVRLGGGIPVGPAGNDRVIGVARVAWGHGQVDTGAELQAGLVGDPFGLRGIFDMAVHF